MLLAVLLLLLKSQTTLSAVVYGLAVHFRIYPIVYAPAIVLYLAHRQQVGLQITSNMAYHVAGHLKYSRSA